MSPRAMLIMLGVVLLVTSGVQGQRRNALQSRPDLQCTGTTFTCPSPGVKYCINVNDDNPSPTCPTDTYSCAKVDWPSDDPTKTGPDDQALFTCKKTDADDVKICILSNPDTSLSFYYDTCGTGTPVPCTQLVNFFTKGSTGGCLYADGCSSVPSTYGSYYTPIIGGNSKRISHGKFCLKPCPCTITFGTLGTYSKCPPVSPATTVSVDAPTITYGVDCGNSDPVECRVTQGTGTCTYTGTGPAGTITLTPTTCGVYKVKLVAKAGCRTVTSGEVSITLDDSATLNVCTGSGSGFSVSHACDDSTTDPTVKTESTFSPLTCMGTYTFSTSDKDYCGDAITAVQKCFSLGACSR